MKKSPKKDGQTQARPTPPLPEIIPPAQPVAMDSPEYDRWMRQRILAHNIERHAAKVKQ